MQNHEMPAFPVQGFHHGLSKLEYIAATIYAHGDLDAYESAKAAITIMQACADIAEALDKPQAKK